MSWFSQVSIWTLFYRCLSTILMWVPFWCDKGEEFISWPREKLWYVTMEIVLCVQRKFYLHQSRGRAWKAILDRWQAIFEGEHSIYANSSWGSAHKLCYKLHMLSSSKRKRLLSFGLVDTWIMMMKHNSWLETWMLL